MGLWSASRPDLLPKATPSALALTSQAGRVWSKTLADTLTKMDFTQIKSDPSVYVFLRDTLRIIIPVFVDDMTLISKSKPSISAFIKELSTHFKLRAWVSSWSMDPQVTSPRRCS